MDKYDKWYEILSKRLKGGERFGLRMNLEGEGKFKDFQGENEIPALREFIEKARKDRIEAITLRDQETEKAVVSEF